MAERSQARLYVSAKRLAGTRVPAFIPQPQQVARRHILELASLVFTKGHQIIVTESSHLVIAPPPGTLLNKSTSSASGEVSSLAGPLALLNLST